MTDFYSKLLARVNESGCFAPHNHIYVTELRDDHSASGVLEIQPSSLNPLGIVHGGALVTLADTVAGTAAYTTGKTCVTLDCSMQYLSPGTGTRIHCTAVPKKLGRTVLVYDVSLTDDSGRPVASGTYTFFAVEPHAPGHGPPEGRSRRLCARRRLLCQPRPAPLRVRGVFLPGH